MTSKSLELVLPRIMRKLEGVQNTEDFTNIRGLKMKIDEGIKQYNERQWIDSAGQFIKVWRDSQNLLARSFQTSLSKINAPETLEQMLEHEGRTTRTIACLGIYALHDAIASFYQTPNDAPTIEVMKARFSIDYPKEDNFGLVTGSGLIIDKKKKDSGVPITSIFPVIDAIGQIINLEKIPNNIAPRLAMFTLKHSRMIETKENFLPSELQEEVKTMMNCSLALIIALSETYFPHTPKKILKEVNDLKGLENEEAWNEIIQECIKKFEQDTTNNIRTRYG